MSWKIYIQPYEDYLRLERGLAYNSIEAYVRDIEKFIGYLDSSEIALSPEELKVDQIAAFMKYLKDRGVASSSQSRILSGVKAFYKFLVIQNIIEEDPASLVEAPRYTRRLPDVLSVEEIEFILSKIDLSKPEGVRNRAMVEVLYSSGLRVSELIHLKISELYLDIGFIKVTGKGSKERFVPIGTSAIKYLKIYLEEVRKKQLIKLRNEDFVFLNRTGKRLSRIMVFMIIKTLTESAGIYKKVSPHTFRHSFATHMIEGGADLRAIQEMMGHESITTTEIYTHLDKDFLKQVLTDFHPRGK